MLSLGVEVDPECSREQRGILSNHSDLPADFQNVDLVDVDAIDQDLASADLDDPRKGLRDGRLASSCAAYDADLHARFHVEGKVLKHDLCVRSVSQKDVIEFDLALRWPDGFSRRGLILEAKCPLSLDFVSFDVLGGTGLARKLLGDLIKIENSLERDHVSLDGCERIHGVLKG
jgi:hypothetical protein